MTLFERRLLVRFGILASKIVLVLAWLAVTIQLPRIVDLARRFDPDSALALALRLAGFLEVSLIFAAPLALTAVVLELKRTGLLTTLLVGGLRLAHLRRLFLVAAVVTSLAATIAIETTSAVRSAYLARRERRRTLVAREGTSYLWVFDRSDREELGGERRGLVFAASSLDVGYADGVRWSGRDGAFSLTPPRPVAGAPTAGRVRFTPAQGGLDTFLPPVSSWWVLRAILSWVNRATLAGALLVFSGYTALLVPIARPRSAYLLLVFVFPAAGLGAFWCSTLLWTHERLGVGAEAAWIALLLGAACLLDVAFARRGLRSA